MGKHTPTPWTVAPDDREGYERNIHIVEAANPDRRICFMTSGGPSGANAALVEALQKIVAADQIERSTTVKVDPAGNTYAIEMVDGPYARIARAVLARLEGR